MTRKDYVIIAQALRTAYASHSGATLEYHEATCRTVALSLEADNPSFDFGRFMAACGVEK